MRRARFQRWLDMLAALGMIAASITVIAVAMWPKAGSGSAAAPTVFVGQPPTYSVGDRLEIPGIDLTLSRSTLLLYLKSTCKYCTASMPFYKRLADLASETRLIVIGPERREQLTTYVAGHGFKPDEIIEVDGAGLKFTGTPTLLLVGADGAVDKVWLGQLDGPRQQEVQLNLR